MKLFENDVMAQAQFENLKKGKDLPVKKRIIFYLSFFKFQIIIVAFVLFLTIWLLCTIFLSPDTYLYGSFANTNNFLSVSDIDFAKKYLEDIGIDTKKNKMSFDSSLAFSDQEKMYAISSLYTHISGAEMDFLVCTPEVFEKIGKNGMIKDINEVSVLNDKYKDRIYYYDDKPIGIDISDSPVLKKESAYNEGSTVIFCFLVNSPREDRSLEFLDWLMK